MANQSIQDENPALTAVVTGAVNGDTINYTLATTATQFSNVGISYCCDFRANPNYSVVSTNDFKRNSKSIAVTVIADGKSKYTGMKILRLLLWLLVLSMAIPSTIPSNYCHSIL
jgi:hypothetical protein